MKLSSSKDLFAELRGQGRGIPAFNVYDLKTVQSVLKASTELQYPAMLAFGERYLTSANFTEIYAVVSAAAESFAYPVVLHLDHCSKLENIRKAVECGFRSVMYDGSSLPLEQNIENTKKAVQIAHSFDAAIEGELGYLNQENADIPSMSTPDQYTSVEDAITYCRETGVDSLAVSVGNVHGLYKGTPHLDFNRLDAIYKAVQKPLVLHGCSGISQKMLAKAMKTAVVKMNVNTEISLAATDAIRFILDASPNDTVIRYEKLLIAAGNAMTEAMKPFIEVCREPEKYL